MPVEPTETPAVALVQILEEIATSLSMRCERNPNALTRTASKASDMAKEAGMDTTAFTSVASEDRCAGLFVDYHAILISDLPAPKTGADLVVEELHTKLASQQRRAAIAMTWLPPSMRSDLNLFIVAPPGSSDSLEWSEFAAQTERNEQVCRKLVWLPPADKQSWRGSAKSFCERTFLARPWTAQNLPSGSAQLDPLAGILQGDHRMARWLAVMEKDTEEDSELADALMRALESSPGEGAYVP
ncbi:ABC-three component system middle component 1 [Fimbriiglobus ruber]|uniref:ABC-three component system middle component 1 n=1 Tax=Fimbriiglobus ruber TaxID=1908690 RepID=UPI000B4B8355|nr:ABC-three component system middle component 1 [Fimbriiglobus ruber]